MLHAYSTQFDGQLLWWVEDEEGDRWHDGFFDSLEGLES